jgi:5-methylcytosine-specific restriction protein A
MPSRPPRVCARPGCTRTTKAGPYCAQCTAARQAKRKPADYDAHRPSAARRAYGRKWQPIRAAVLRRDAYICQHCGQPAGKSAHVDHIVPKAEGGTDDQDNLETLCRGCHSRKTVRENRGRPSSQLSKLDS